MCSVVTHPYPTFNVDLVKPPMNLVHGSVITSDSFAGNWLVIHALIPILDKVKWPLGAAPVAVRRRNDMQAVNLQRAGLLTSPTELDIITVKFDISYAL